MISRRSLPNTTILCGRWWGCAIHPTGPAAAVVQSHRVSSVLSPGALLAPSPWQKDVCLRVGEPLSCWEKGAAVVVCRGQAGVQRWAAAPLEHCSFCRCPDMKSNPQLSHTEALCQHHPLHPKLLTSRDTHSVSCFSSPMPDLVSSSLTHYHVLH